MDIKTYLNQSLYGEARRLSEVIGCSRDHIYALKAGRTLPSVDMAAAIQKATRGKVKASEWIRRPK